MKTPHNIKEVVKSHLCIGCGLCIIDKETQGIQLSHKNDCLVPKNVKVSDTSLANIICPGKGYDIKGTGENLFANEAKYSLQLGYINSLYASHSLNDEVLENASSGGVITQLLLYLLDKKIVDYVSVTQFVCDSKGVHTRTFLTSEKKEILKAQGSKYCPVNFDTLLDALHQKSGRVAIMATPCVIAGFRKIQIHQPNYIKAHIVFHIANFCGGFKSFRNIKRLAEIHQVDYHNLCDFRFRGEGQPGSLRFIENTGKVASTSYPLYVGLNGYSKMLRCHLCPDATGELADIACGDAWIPRFQDDNNTWSMIICRNNAAKELVENMKKDGVIATASVTSDEVELSQRINLASKKKRQLARMNLYNKLGYYVPDFKNHGYSIKKSPIKTEIIVYIKHQLTLLAEKAGLYMILYGNKKLKKK